MHTIIGITISTEAKWAALNRHRAQLDTDILFRELPEAEAKKCSATSNPQITAGSPRDGCDGILDVIILTCLLAVEKLASH